MLKALGYPVLAIGLVLAMRAFSPAEPTPFEPAPVADEFATLPPIEVSSAPAAASKSLAKIVPPRPVLVVRLTTPAVNASAATSSATVTVAPWRTLVVTSAASGGDRSAGPPTTAANGADRYELIRSIQRELRRTGCYAGAIDGSWGGASKRALAAFIDRVNASLPFAEPDHILLSLIRAQPGAACGACPRGQSFDSGGRCVPDAVLALAAKRDGIARTTGATTESGARVAWTAEVRPSAGSGGILPPPTSLAGRMSIGGPQPVAQFSAVPEGDRLRSNVAGDAPATGVGVPARNGATYTTASLTEGEDPTSQLEDLNGTPREMMPAAVPAPPRTVKASKPARRTNHATRSVHQLFTHPLGRM